MKSRIYNRIIRPGKIRDLQPTSKTWANTQALTSMINDYLIRHGVNAVITGIAVDASEDTVMMRVSSNLDRLFQSVVPAVVIIEREDILKF